MTDSEATARAYYDALDGHDYEGLAALLAPGFVHDRPDQTIEGRDRFVRFMREERPNKETNHPIDGVYSDADRPEELVVRGRLLDAGGERIVAFVDVFSFANGCIERIETYTR